MPPQLLYGSGRLQCPHAVVPACRAPGAHGAADGAGRRLVSAGQRTGDAAARGTGRRRGGTGLPVRAAARHAAEHGPRLTDPHLPRPRRHAPGRGRGDQHLLRAARGPRPRAAHPRPPGHRSGGAGRLAVADGPRHRRPRPRHRRRRGRRGRCARPRGVADPRGGDRRGGARLLRGDLLLGHAPAVPDRGRRRRAAHEPAHLRGVATRGHRGADHPVHAAAAGRARRRRGRGLARGAHRLRRERASRRDAAARDARGRRLVAGPRAAGPAEPPRARERGRHSERRAQRPPSCDPTRSRARSPTSSTPPSAPAPSSPPPTPTPTG